MKTKPNAPASATLRTQLATAEQNLQLVSAQEADAWGQCNALQAQLAEIQRTADPANLSAITKASAKIRAELHEAQAALTNARDISTRLEAEAHALRRELQDADTAAQRRAAAQAPADLLPLAEPIERAAADLIAALKSLREAGGKARVLVGDAMQALCGDDPARMEDMRQLVLNRAEGTGPEVASAIAAILYAVAEVSGTQLGGHVAFNEFNRGTLTMSQALKGAATVVASRLGVQL